MPDYGLAVGCDQLRCFHGVNTEPALASGLGEKPKGAQATYRLIGL